MREMMRYLRGYRRDALLGPLLKLAEAALELLVPLTVAAVIDKGIAGQNNAYILRMCLLMAALGAAGLAFSVTAQYFAARASAGFTARMRSAVFGHIQRLSCAQLDAAGTSGLITRMTSDANQVQNGLNLALRLLLRSPFVVFGAMAMAFVVDARAAVVFAVVIPVLAVVVFGVMLACIPLYRLVQRRLDGVLGLVRENLGGVRVLRAFCLEEQQQRTFAARHDELSAAQRLVGRIAAVLNPATYFLVDLALIALLRTGALRVEAGLLTQGALVALYNYLAQILTELIKLADLIINITRALACARRIQAVMELPAQDAPAPVQESTSAQSTPKAAHKAACAQDAPAADTGHTPAAQGAAAAEVVFEDVSMCYPGAAQPALRHISLRALPGQTFGIIGGTGAGKSTLVELIPRLYEVTQGAVKVDGRDVREWPVQALRARIGIVPQQARLFAGTVRENLLWGNAQADDDALWQALETAQMLPTVRSMPDGLDTVLAQGGRDLSGGQRQRLTIARALVRRPAILILDDSASALDLATDAALRAALRALRPSPTVFIVSQRTAALQQAACILVLEEGEAVGLGTHAQLLQSCAVYREIHDSQFKKEAAPHA